MSQATYNKIWADAQEDLDTQLQTEREQFLQVEKDSVKAFRMLAASYIKYLQIFRSLEEAHDHLIHQQKRVAIQKVLNGVMGRMLELKKEMVELEKSEFHYIDNIIDDLKLLPEDAEIPIPRYFIKENLEALQQREKTLDEILLNAGLETQKPVKAMTFEEAVKTIQVAERARQGRRRALFKKQIYLQWKTKRHPKLQEKTGPNPDDAATCIQKVWRGYIQRKKTEQMREEEIIFLGMSLPPHSRALRSTSHVHARQEDALRGEVQERQEEEFIKDQLREIEGLNIRETLQDQIKQCFIECRHIIGRFPDYPSKEAGGSMAIFSQKTPEQVAAELAAKREAALQKKTQKGKQEEKGKKKAKEKEAQKTGIKKEDEGWKMAPSNFLPILEEGNSHYKAVWQNRDQGRDFLQDHDPELIKAEKREEVEEEIRVQVDELMQQKLEDLKLAVDGEKSSKKKNARKREKKKKAGKKKISELEKDVTPDRTIDSLYRELVEEGILIKAKPVKLADYVGEYSYLGTTLHKVDVEPMPSLADIRQLIALYGILPLGSQTVHEKAPLVKTLLLAGPTGVGKKMLVHAICTETGANLFNLSPSNIAGKYPGKDGLQMMLHMVLKVAKQLQPSVMWIGDTEKTFYKAVPKADEQMNPKRLEKFLPKLLKALNAKDRVLLVGTTSRPFDAKIKPFCRIYQKIILIPRPDYASRFVLWKHTIRQHGGEITKLLSISCLAKLSDGFTQGNIVQVVQAVLSKLRLLQMARKPLHTAEFLTPLASQDPVYSEEEETFKAWYDKTPLGQARSKAMEMSEKGGKGKKK
ncbi:dynein regulatory complex protein 11 [Cyrtonyx montezumae]|uniref:dynein regulatory complex protein 11 n=1 Tax=Cyrtonyx montezumae TaxID=9017 RepID=UPI0032DBA4BA